MLPNFRFSLVKHNGSWLNQKLVRFAHNWKIHKPEAIEISKQYGCSIEPIETSAKTGENVEEAFIALTQEIIKMRLHECKSCSEYFTKKLKFCPKCGEVV